MKTNTITNETEVKGSYRTPDGKAQIDFEITTRNGYPEYTSTGHFDGSSGQNLDSILAAYPDNEHVKSLHNWWTAHHLESVANHPAFMDKVRRAADNFPAVSFYNKQATDFLTRNGLKMRITLSNSKSPSWAKEGEETGHHYRVTIWQSQGSLVGGVNAPNRSKLTFDFWGSIADAQAGITTERPYSVLACISGDAYTPETFADFCAEYGYESDSIKALQQHRRCLNFSRRLRAFFTEKELNELSEIQ